MINWAIFGTSFISQVMAEAIKASSHGHLSAVLSRDKDRGERFQNKYKIDKCFNDLTAALADKSLDAVYIGLPNHIHFEAAMACMKAGLHVLCEKPLTTSADESCALAEASTKYDRLLIEALMYRYHPYTQRLHEIIASGRLGDIKLINATYTANIAHLANPVAGGGIRNLGCYPLSTVNSIMKDSPQEMLGHGFIHEQSGNDRISHVIMKYKNQASALITTADTLDMSWHLSVHGTKARMLSLTNPWLPEQKNNELHIFNKDKKSPEIITVNADKPLYTYQIDFMNERLLNKTTGYAHAQSLADSVENTRLLELWREQVLNFRFDRKTAQSA